MRVTMAMILCLGLAAPALAEPLKAADARKALPRDKGVAVEMIAHPKLPPDQAKVLAMVAQGQAHYGAVAFSPDDGLMSEATVAAVDFHSTEAAAKAAAADCDGKRKGRAPCAVVALIRPAGWTQQPLQMSASAAEAFRKDYGRSGQRAMALSVGSGKFGLGKGDAAQILALSACNAGNAAADCALVVAD
jgi:hypothetical protein